MLKRIDKLGGPLVLLLAITTLAFCGPFIFGELQPLLHFALAFFLLPAALVFVVVWHFIVRYFAVNAVKAGYVGLLIWLSPCLVAFYFFFCVTAYESLPSNRFMRYADLALPDSANNFAFGSSHGNDYSLVGMQFDVAPNDFDSLTQASIYSRNDEKGRSIVQESVASWPYKDRFGKFVRDLEKSQKGFGALEFYVVDKSFEDDHGLPITDQRVLVTNAKHTRVLFYLVYLSY